jgi:C_GCAxxG_C_C family probable redox protein
MDDRSQAMIERARQRARANFSTGYNCAECVAEAVLATLDTGLPVGSWKLATGFGGGIGLYGDTCGALTGAVLAVSAVHGRSTLPEGKTRQDALILSRRQLYEDPGLYRIFNQIPNWFFRQYGHTLCRDLTAKWRDDWLCREHALFCREIITEAAGLAVTLMRLTSDDLRLLPFGRTVEQLDRLTDAS